MDRIKMIRTTAALAAAILIAVGCVRETVREIPVPPVTEEGVVPMTLTAGSTKTMLQSNKQIWWEAGDRISVFDGSGNREFVTSDGGASVTFAGAAIANADKYVLYPYDSLATMDSPGVITTLVRGTQVPRSGSFGAGNNVSVAKVSGSSFYSLNVCGVLKVTVDRDDVSAIDICSANRTEILAGKATITIPNSGTPTVAISDGSYKVCLVPSGEVFDRGTYYADALPCTLADGYRIRVTYADGNRSDITVSSEAEIERSRSFDLGTIGEELDGSMKILTLNFYDRVNSAVVQPFTTNIPNYASGSSANYVLRDGGVDYAFSIYSSTGYGMRNSSTYTGLELSGEGTTAWIKLPALEGRGLRSVGLVSGTTMTNSKTFYITEGTDQDSVNNPLAVVSLQGGTEPILTTQSLDSYEKNKSYYLYLPPTSNSMVVLREIHLYYTTEDFNSPDGPFWIKAKKQGQTSWTMCYETTTVNDIPGFSPVASEPPLDEYGGWTGIFTFPATGWFYCAKHNGRWWMVDPLGNPFISKGLCGFRLDLGSDVAKNAFKTKYNSDYDLWANGEWAMLSSYGFNSFGSFSNYARIKQHLRVPYTVLISIATSWKNQVKSNYPGVAESDWGSEGPYDIPMVFEPGWAEYADARVQSLVAAYSDDPYCMGFMSDNELPLQNADLKNCITKFSPGDAFYDAATAWLAANSVTYEEAVASVDWQRKFAAYIYETYLSAVATAVKKYAPNHMYQGTKMTGNNNGLVNPYVFQVSGEYCDAISVDYYHVWTPSSSRIGMWEGESGKPIILAEWYVKGDDTELANTSGVGWTVPTQTDRGRYYQNYVIGALKTGKVVGWHWFRYMDNDPDADNSGNLSNVDANKGVVTRTIEPYTAFLSEMKKVNNNVYPLCEFFTAD